MNKKVKKLIFIFALLIGFFVIFNRVFAAETIFKPEVTIGNEFKAGQAVTVTGTTLAKYIVAIYKWSIRAIAILAVIIIMVAGFRWMTAAGNASIISQAKEQIISALIGLILAIGANFLLYFLNPALVRLKSLNLTKIKKQTVPASEVKVEFCLDDNTYDCVNEEGYKLGGTDEIYAYSYPDLSSGHGYEGHYYIKVLYSDTIFATKIRPNINKIAFSFVGVIGATDCENCEDSPISIDKAINLNNFKVVQNKEVTIDGKKWHEYIYHGWKVGVVKNLNMKEGLSCIPKSGCYRLLSASLTQYTGGVGVATKADWTKPITKIIVIY
ncbi:hypothetical protein J7K86_01825 [bacterium]|nr:hypothetical protein [bacterium]